MRCHSSVPYVTLGALGCSELAPNSELCIVTGCGAMCPYYEEGDRSTVTNVIQIGDIRRLGQWPALWQQQFPCVIACCFLDYTAVEMSKPSAGGQMLASDLIVRRAWSASGCGRRYMSAGGRPSCSMSEKRAGRSTWRSGGRWRGLARRTARRRARSRCAGSSRS
jgi:hypothetical protein